ALGPEAGGRRPLGRQVPAHVDPGALGLVGAELLNEQRRGGLVDLPAVEDHLYLDPARTRGQERLRELHAGVAGDDEAGDADALAGWRQVDEAADVAPDSVAVADDGVAEHRAGLHGHRSLLDGPRSALRRCGR